MNLNYIKSILYIGILIGCFSCEVTDLIPEDSITDVTYWKTPADLELFANQFYSNLDGPSATADDNTDIVATKNINTFVSGAYVVPNTDDGWKWTNLRNTNYFLNRYQTVTGDEKLINQYIAEVRFFRALDYAAKIKRYGDVPWYDKDLNTSDTELIFKARDPRSLLISKIIDDLEFACTHLQEPAKVAKGRLHTYAAYNLLARFCLHEGTHAKYHQSATIDATGLLKKAATAAKYIMDNGGYAISTTQSAPYEFADYPLPYYALFVQLTDISDDKEVILARHYQKDVLMHGVTRQVEAAGSGLSKVFVEQYLGTDGKPASLHPNYSDETIEVEVNGRDPRLYQTIDNKHLPFKIDRGKIVINEVTTVDASRCPTGYHTMKMHHPDPNQWTANACYTQYPVFRYAETLLIYAEACAELGQADQTVIDQTINLIRSRVNMPPLQVNAITPDPNKLDYGYELSDLLREIRRERSIELIREGFRWDDIVRWKAGKLFENPKCILGMTVNKEVAANYAPGTFDLDGSGSGIPLADINGKKLIRLYTNIQGGYKWNDKCYLYPLPKDELALNPNLLPQNPGW